MEAKGKKEKHEWLKLKFREMQNQLAHNIWKRFNSFTLFTSFRESQTVENAIAIFISLKMIFFISFSISGKI